MSIKSLSQFQGNSEIFKDAVILPQFFKNNLANPARVVKAFKNDPQGHIRIFYYQYLKLCFELENINYDFYIRKIEQIINSEFHFIFYQDDDPAIFNDIQAKSLIMEFFGVLGEGHSNVQAALSQYPIMDYIFVHFFRTLLIQMGKTDALDSYLSRDQILGFLCPQFGVGVQIHSECIKYVQTDIFVYEQNPQSIYMAYMESEQQNQNIPEMPISIQQKQQYLPPTPPAPVQKHEDIQTKAADIAAFMKAASVPYQRNSYIAGQFMDFTSLYSNLSGDSNANGKVTQSPVIEVSKLQYKPSFFKQQNKSIEETEKKTENYYSEFTDFNKPTFNSVNEVHTIQITKPSKIDIEVSSSKANYSEYFPSVQPTKDIYGSSSISSQINSSLANQSQYNAYDPFKYQSSQDNHAYKSTDKNTANNLISEQKKEPFYSPKQNSPYNAGIMNFPKIQTPKIDSKVTNNINGGFTKRKPFGLNVSEEFTNSITMKAMVEPYRSNVHNMKTRARNFRDSLIPYIK